MNPLRPEEVSDPSAYDFDRQELRPRGDGRMCLYILRTCLDCKRQDWVKNNSIRTGKSSRGYCKKCAYNHMPSPVRDGFKSKREAYLHYTYDLSLIDFEAMWDDQHGLCAICQETMDKPYVDHSHESGEVRGLLCRSCNSAIGLFKENILSLRRAITYLVKAPDALVVPGRG